jgi:HD-GYP domain-containing protein (c-di-GMP phosphodiesterase class II)
VADAFDTMTTDRSYRSAISIDKAIKELNDCAGTQFCPIAVKALITGLRLNETGK